MVGMVSAGQVEELPVQVSAGSHVAFAPAARQTAPALPAVLLQTPVEVLQVSTVQGLLSSQPALLIHPPQTVLSVQVLVQALEVLAAERQAVGIVVEQAR